jgi:hypothetical protein
MNFELIDNFKRKYDDYLKNFDAFFVGYPAAFLLLFAHLEKPIIVSNCVRYDMPFCWSRDFVMLDHLNKTINDLNGKGLLTVISNNLADHDYFSLGPHGVSSTLIPTIGEYANLNWSPNRTDSLLYSGENIFTPSPNLIRRSSLGNFDLRDLNSFSSIIHLPYEVSTMSMSEQYAGGIPLLFPSESFLSHLWNSNEKLLQSRYWYHQSIGAYPNYLETTMGSKFNQWWTSRSDFFHHLSEVNYYDSIENAIEMTSSLDSLSNLIRPSKQHLNNRRKKYLDAWKNVLKNVDLGTH